jgi:hypothetical protein
MVSTPPRFAKTFGVPAQCGEQAHFVQQWRMKQMRHGAYLFDGVVHHVKKLGTALLSLESFNWFG